MHTHFPLKKECKRQVSQFVYRRRACRRVVPWFCSSRSAGAIAACLSLSLQWMHHLFGGRSATHVGIVVESPSRDELR